MAKNTQQKFDKRVSKFDSHFDEPPRNINVYCPHPKCEKRRPLVYVFSVYTEKGLTPLYKCKECLSFYNGDKICELIESKENKGLLSKLVKMVSNRL